MSQRQETPSNKQTRSAYRERAQKRKEEEMRQMATMMAQQMNSNQNSQASGVSAEEFQRLRQELDHYKAIVQNYQKQEPFLNEVVQSKQKLDTILTELAADYIAEELIKDPSGRIPNAELNEDFINYACENGIRNVNEHNVAKYMRANGIEYRKSNGSYSYRGASFKNAELGSPTVSMISATTSPRTPQSQTGSPQNSTVHAQLPSVNH